MSNPSRPEETGSTTGQAGGLGVVGHYEITGEVGRGGMAVVWLARQTDLDRLVALKELAPFHAADPAFAAASCASRDRRRSLSHPNIVTVHDYFEHEGGRTSRWSIMERGSLRPLVGLLSPRRSAGVLEGMLGGLTWRDAGHRPPRPEAREHHGHNDGRVKIADFGIAKATQPGLGERKFHTATGTAVGTPAYMAPEQAMARSRALDRSLRGRCHRLGALVGRVPFCDADTPGRVLCAASNEPPPAPTPCRPDSTRRSRSGWEDAREPPGRPLSARRPTRGTRSRRSWCSSPDRSGGANRA